MSNGSDRLTRRDPGTFAALEGVDVRIDGAPVRQLNELECARGQVFANVWQTDTIVRIDPSTGFVTGEIDASGLLTPAEARSADVLNGIAYLEESGTFLLTGKLWPRVFEVELIPR